MKKTIRQIKTASREEWLELRRHYIGGSDAGAVVGLNDYSSPYHLWAEKTGRIPGFEGNITTEVGAYLEELVAQMFTRETGKKVRRKGVTMINEAYPFACADVDRVVVGEDAILEIKTTNSFPTMRKLRGGEYPDTWYAQMTHYLAVTGAKKAYLAVLINCREFKVFELQRDENEIIALMTAEAAFWKHVTEDTPPEADGSEATADAIATIYRESNGNSLELFGREEMLEDYFLLAADKKDIERRMDMIKHTIQMDMGEAERGNARGYTVTWKTQPGRKQLDISRLAAEHPEIDLSTYYSTGRPVRMFKIKEDK